MYFEIYLSPVGGIIAQATRQWRWRLKAANHEIIASGESYTTRENCLKAVHLIQATSNQTPIKEVHL